MAERLTAEERATIHRRYEGSWYSGTPQTYKAIGQLLDSLDAAEAEVARLQTLHVGRDDFLGVLFKEMTMILEGDCAEAKVRCAINRWCGLFESLEGSEPE